MTIRLRRRLIRGLARRFVRRRQRARMRLRSGLNNRHRHLHVGAGHAVADHDRVLGADLPGRRQLNVGTKCAGGRHFGDAPRSLISSNSRRNPGRKSDAVGAHLLPVVERDDDKAARRLRTGAPARTLHMQRRTDRDNRRNDDGRPLFGSGETLSAYASNSVDTICGLRSDKHSTDDGSRRGQSQ